MSTSLMNQSKGTSKGTQSKFCKVCYDAGKEYTTHYVRDSIGGTVVCPTLLNQQCKYCKKTGHTPSHCPALEGKYNKNYKEVPAKQTREDRFNQLRESPPPNRKAPAPDRKAPAPDRKAPAPASKTKNSGKNYSNTLANILEEEAVPVSESKREAALTDNFPILSLRPSQIESGKIIRTAPNKLNVWATVAAQAPPVQQAPVQIKKAEEPEAKAEADSDSDSEDDESKVEVKKIYISWADME